MWIINYNKTNGANNIFADCENIWILIKSSTIHGRQCVESF